MNLESGFWLGPLLLAACNASSYEFAADARATTTAIDVSDLEALRGALGDAFLDQRTRSDTTSGR